MTEAMVEKVREILASKQFTETEKFIVKWQFGMLGSFKAALVDVIKLADEDNLAKLAKGFPEEVAVFIAWNAGDLAERLREAGLEV